ncbi:DnaJ domain-containing protein [Candidatus Nomurabacteria bacterium]|nr:DnaJ domain-containing protein [Candidatus Nomurabacteria bacterium]
METTAFFSNIRSHISTELIAARFSINLAIAWFTDRRLFDILCQQAEAGLDVQLIVMDDDITRNCSIDYSKLESCGGRLFLINPGLSGIVMHNKFCVIDGNITITGSYNWSVRAQGNHENITITKDSTDLAEMFLTEFRRIKEQYYGKEPLKDFDVEIISKRLTIIHNLILLGETDQLDLHVNRIREYHLISDVELIIVAIESQEYQTANSRLQDYLKRISSITLFEYSDIEQLKWQIKYFEIEIISLENEKALIEKIISDFVHTYTLEFGEILLKILELKKEKLKQEGKNKKSEEFEKAEQDYKEQKDRFRQESNKDLGDLDKDEAEELKTNYRKAVQLCHPDKFPDEEQKAKAHKVFVELHEAYSRNDLKKVNEILHNLEMGIYEIDDTFHVSKREQLLHRLESLMAKHRALSDELKQIRNDKSYRDIIAIKNMDQFFEEERLRLENELISLENGQR